MRRVGLIMNCRNRSIGQVKAGSKGMFDTDTLDIGLQPAANNERDRLEARPTSTCTPSQKASHGQRRPVDRGRRGNESM